MTLTPSPNPTLTQRKEKSRIQIILGSGFAFGCLLLFGFLSSPPQNTEAKESMIQGKVELKSELKSKLKPSAVLYVIARSAEKDGEKGPPLAVKRITQPFQFPHPFSLSSADAMMPGVQLSGKVAISARISQAGAATPALPGDIEGSSKPKVIKVGSSEKVIIQLNKVR